MKQYFHTLFSPALIALGAILSSCNPSQIEVVDHSFDISAKVSYDRESMESTLALQLERGDSQNSYSVSYSIDGEYVPVLLDQYGNAVKNIFSLSFKSSPAVRYSLSELRSGNHTLSFDISTDNHSIHLDCPFTVEVDRFSIHAEANTSSSVSSVVLVSLVSGRTDKLYEISILSSEGETLATEKDVDFQSTPIVSVALPLLRPGQYSLHVEVSDGMTVQDAEIILQEPVRHPRMQVKLLYNSTTNSIGLAAVDNPYGLSLSAEVEGKVQGSVTVNLESGYFHGGPDRRTYTREIGDTFRRDAFVPVPGKTEELCCFNDLDRQMREQFMQSYVWVEGYDREQEEEGTWCLHFTMPEYFKVTGHTAAVRITYEKIEGVTVTLYSQNVSWISPSFAASK